MVVSNLPKLKEVIIDGVDVSSFVLAFEIEEHWDETIKAANVVLKRTVNTVLDFNDKELSGATITVTRGVSLATETYLFRGFVRKIDFEGGLVKIGCEDKLSICKYTIVNTSYDINVDPEAGVISEIVTSLVDENTSLTIDATSVVNSGTVNVIKKFVLRQRVLMDALQELAYQLDYQIYYDPETDKVHFEPKGYLTSATVLTVGTEIVQLPKWTIDSSRLFNRIIVKGSPQEKLTVEGPFALDGVAQSDWTTTSITLDNKPIAVKVLADAANPPTTERVGGIEGSTSTFDYEVDTELLQIAWSSTYTPLATDFAQVEYTFLQSVLIVRKNSTSISLYTGGEAKTVSQFREDIKNVDDAEKWAAKQLAMFSVPFYKTQLKIRSTPTLKVGTVYRIVDNSQNIDRNLMVKKIRYSWPYRYDEIEVSDQEFRTANWGSDTLARLKRLEEKQADNDDLLVDFIDLVREFKFERRYNKILRRKIFDSYLYNHPVNSLIEMGIILDNFDSSDANWTESAGITDTDESGAGNFLTGTGSLKVEFTDTGSQTLTTTQSFGDVSTYTGVANGTPSQGTCGLWWKSPNTTGITAIKLRIGSGASDYIECSGREYATVDGYNNFGNLTFDLRTAWNYYLFDLDNPDSTVGTPDWTACDYARIEFTVASTHTGYVDYLTISQSDLIGLNGYGDRSQLMDDPKMIIQGKMTYKEYAYDDEFHDSVNSTATFSTITNDIQFTAGQIWYSNAIDIRTTLSWITTTLGTVTGTVKIEISSDNKATWQEITEGVRTAVSSSDGTGTYVRITENAGGVAAIDLTTNAFGQNTEPLINTLMEE